LKGTAEKGVKKITVKEFIKERIYKRNEEVSC
jgi:hypothetical protein